MGFYAVLVLPLREEMQGLLLFTFALCAILSVAITLFASYHVYIVFIGKTTLEVFGKPRPGTALFSYSGTWRSNLKQVFGTASIWKILIPSRRELKGDGVHWPDARLVV